MDNANELLQTMQGIVEQLRNAAALTDDAVNRLTKLFNGTKEAKTTEIEASPVTLEEVRAVLAEKSRCGHTAEIRELLRKYGASRLSEVDPKHYLALFRDAEALKDAA